ncbi:hypothetical protein H2248_002269 [Termitomyces sp. 'cryptogamus']|nr:hypothetical protein H2248_002269 [Termitomyces sp. 'cryptogamus']
MSTPASNDAGSSLPPKRGRGRPRGSRNRLNASPVGRTRKDGKPAGSGKSLPKIAQVTSVSTRDTLSNTPATPSTPSLSNKSGVYPYLPCPAA